MKTIIMNYYSTQKVKLSPSTKMVSKTDESTLMTWNDCLYENVKNLNHKTNLKKQLLAFLDNKKTHNLKSLWIVFPVGGRPSWGDFILLLCGHFQKLCVCVKDLEQSVEEDNAGELVLGISLPDNEGQCDGGRQFITAVRLRQAGLPAGHTGHFCTVRQTPNAAKYTWILITKWELMIKRRFLTHLPITDSTSLLQHPSASRMRD